MMSLLGNHIAPVGLMESTSRANPHKIPKMAFIFKMLALISIFLTSAPAIWAARILVIAPNMLEEHFKLSARQADLLVEQGDNEVVSERE